MLRLVMWMEQNRWLTAGIGAGAFLLTNQRRRKRKRRRRR
jgi:hypothetical protein